MNHPPERERRYAMEVAVEVGVGRSRCVATTRDVGERGMFVRSDIVGPLRGLVTLDVDLPYGLSPLSAHAMIVHVVPPGTAGRDAGMGVALFGLDRTTRELWRAFIARVRERVPELAVLPLVATRTDAEPPPALARSHANARVVLEVRPPLVADLVQMYTRDLKLGQVLLQTGAVLEAGDGFVLRIVHPARRDRLCVPCRVTRVVDDASMRGLGAELLDLDDSARALFWAFTGVEVAALEDQRVIVVQESG